jgi:hypothetical protein
MAGRTNFTYRLGLTLGIELSKFTGETLVLSRCACRSLVPTQPHRRCGAKRAEVTVESLLTEPDEVLAGAVSDRQFGAARAAIDSKARLKGLFVDKVEIGQPRDFSPPTVAENAGNDSAKVT